MFLQLTKGLIEFVSEANLPVNVIRQPSLKKLLELISKRKISIPTTRFFMKTMNERFVESKLQLIQLLKAQKYVCVTCDVWSSLAFSFIGFTVHFLENYERKSYALALKPLVTRQTYRVLAEIMDDVFKEFQLKKTQICNVVTDGGSAFCKSFKEYTDGNDVIVETLEEDSDLNGEVEYEDATNENGNVINGAQGSETIYMQGEDGEIFHSNVLTFDNDVINHVEEEHVDDIFLNDNVSFADSRNNVLQELLGIATPSNDQNRNVRKIELPPQRRCQTHMLSLTSNDFEDNLTGLTKSALTTAVSKIHAVWVYTHRSCRAKQIVLEVLGRVFIVPVVTRWNSKYDAIAFTCQVDIKPKVNILIERLKAELPTAEHLQTLLPTDWHVLCSYVEVMKHVAIALDRLQGERNGSQGFIIPTLTTMQYRISSLEGGAVLQGFKRTILEVIRKRFDSYFKVTESIRDFILASISLPLFKSTFIECPSDERRAIDMLRDECIQLANDGTDRVDDIVTTMTNEGNDDYFVSFAHNITRRNSLGCDIDAEISRYFADGRKNEGILSEYPNIRNVYYKYNTTLSSSAPVERLFSQCKLIFRPQRNRLSADNFERLLFLKVNEKKLK